jgi:hypothetical protein
LNQNIDALDATFKKWLGANYDLDAIHAALIAAAVNELDGDPLWLLLVGGPGNAKTESVSSLGLSPGVHIVSTIASEGALLSATSKGERAKDATGGLLREIGDRGVVVLKDFTSILSLAASVRPQVLSALREIYDGYWKRTVGADGGRTLTWQGRLALIGAVTTAWDQHHAVVSEMGDRFVLLRMDSHHHRLAGGRQAISNTGKEVQMRADLAHAAARVLDNLDTNPIALTDDESEILLRAADLVTLARTAIMRDGRGEPIDAHAPEAPTRFAKQLAQIVRGGVAIGMERVEAMQLAIRCARDSVPPLRLAVLTDLAANPDAITGDVRKRLQKPVTTVDRELRALHCIGLVVCTEEKRLDKGGRQIGTVWRYRLPAEIDPHSSLPEIYVPPHPQEGQHASTYISGSEDNDDHGSTYISGNGHDTELVAKGKALVESGKHRPKTTRHLTAVG